MVHGIIVVATLIQSFLVLLSGGMYLGGHAKKLPDILSGLLWLLLGMLVFYGTAAGR